MARGVMTGLGPATHAFDLNRKTPAPIGPGMTAPGVEVSRYQYVPRSICGSPNAELKLNISHVPTISE
jgi:hypothetical protein